MTSYTNRDYIAISSLCQKVTQDLYDHGKYAQLEGAYEVIGRLADLFAMDNSKFDRNKFWVASSEIK